MFPDVVTGVVQGLPSFQAWDPLHYLMSLSDLPQGLGRGLPPGLPPGMFRGIRASTPVNMAMNAAVKALNLPASGHVEGQAAYIQAVSNALDALPDTPYHNATLARFQ